MNGVSLLNDRGIVAVNEKGSEAVRRLSVNYFSLGNAMTNETPEVLHIVTGKVEVAWIGESSCNIFREFAREDSAV